MTNNKNRTAAEIRSTFNKYGGSLGETGSVSYNFKHLGEISIDKVAEEEKVFDFAIESGSIDFEVNNDQFVIYCKADNLHSLNEKIINKFKNNTSAQLVWKSDVSITVDNENAEKLFKLLSALEDNEDVQSVSSNFEVNEEILNKYVA